MSAAVTAGQVPIRIPVGFGHVQGLNKRFSTTYIVGTESMLSLHLQRLESSDGEIVEALLLHGNVSTT
jgi:hypothetical protein